MTHILLRSNRSDTSFLLLLWGNRNKTWHSYYLKVKGFIVSKDESSLVLTFTKKTFRAFSLGDIIQMNNITNGTNCLKIKTTIKKNNLWWRLSFIVITFIYLYFNKLGFQLIFFHSGSVAFFIRVVIDMI